jgi:hypothetical protein
VTNDLSRRLRNYVDDVEPIAIDAVCPPPFTTATEPKEIRVAPIGTSSPFTKRPPVDFPRYRRVAAVAAVALLCFAAGAFILASTRPPSTRVDVGSQPSADDTGPFVPSPSGSPAPVRLTPIRSKLPDLAPDEVYVARAAQLDPSERMLMGGSDEPSAWQFPDSGPASVLMSPDGTKVMGVYVTGLGVISRADYDNPPKDFEDMARDRLGAQEYEHRLRATQNSFRP